MPTPLQGWRQFIGEVGVIVLGVLIALGAQQIAQSIDDRQEVAQLRSALQAELADDRARWEHMRSQDVCAAKRLDALERWLAFAPSNARLDNAFYLFLWNMHSSAWDIAKTSAAASDIPLEERLAYGSLYGAIDNWRDFITQEQVNTMQLLAAFATADQPESRRAIRPLLFNARQLQERRQRNYSFFFKRFDDLGIKADASGLNISINTNELCKPLQKSAAG